MKVDGRIRLNAVQKQLWIETILKGWRENMKRLSSALCLLLIFGGTVFAQTTRYGDPNFDRATDWDSGWPTVLNLTSGNVDGVKFDGSPVEISFTISGEVPGATVWLAVYSENANPQYDGESVGLGGPGNALLRAAGIDTFISVTGGEEFSVGDNTIVWDGRDWTGAQVGAGDYRYFLFAIDRESNPTWVGYGMGPWHTARIDDRDDPPSIWSPMLSLEWTEVWTILKGVMGTDLHENPEAVTAYPIPWFDEKAGRDAPGWKDLGGYEVDTVDKTRGYVMAYAKPPSGVTKVEVDEDAGTITPAVDDWADADEGFIHMDQRTFSTALSHAFHHPWVADDGLLYVGDVDREDPKTPAVWKIDKISGEIVEIMDYSDFYLQINDDGSTASSGPAAIDVDETGIYSSGYWFNSRHWPLKRSQDGDIIWQNQNGDGFLDRYTNAEAEALGIPEFDQLWHTGMKVTRWGITFNGGYNRPEWGTVLGPDGAGLFHLNLAKMPGDLGGEVEFRDNSSNIDGMYIIVGNHLVHWPTDITSGLLSEGLLTAVAGIAGPSPTSYELGDNYPNPFNPETTIRIAVPDYSDAVKTTITVYNMTGQEIVRLVDEEMQAGVYEVTWDGRDAHGASVSSGAYMYTMEVGDHFSESKMMTFVK
jgi:hypothetical protein